MDGMNNFSASEFQEMPKNEVALGQEEYCPAMTFFAKICPTRIFPLNYLVLNISGSRSTKIIKIIIFTKTFLTIYF